MAHINTIVRVRANNEAEAIEKVNGLLTNDGEYNAYNTAHSAFDWCAEDETKISTECKSEKDFDNLRELELDAHSDYLKRAEEAKTKNDGMAGYYFRMAGECLEQDSFWCYDRLAYDFARVEQEEEAGKKIYFVDTDRHY